MIVFCYLEKERFPEYADTLFSVLHGNMNAIAPTGQSREADFACWSQAMGEQLKSESRSVILIFYRPTQELAGYFQYSVSDGVFFMEDIQFKPEFQGKHNIFRELYGFVFEHLEDFSVVRANASKRNTKSMGVLRHLGLVSVGENKTGRSYCFLGTKEDLMRWYTGGRR